tara:strand:+ start:1749 stop:2750 length:1002 start_codon:yes stop_codon:yes gene_type:complete
MPILTVREVLSGNAVPNAEGAPSLALVQKRINMPHGKRFRIKSVQCFDDNGTVIADVRRGGDNQLSMRCVYVTPYPIVPSDEAWGATPAQANLTGLAVGAMGPYAGDNTVLYKRIDINNNLAGDENWNTDTILTEEFPNAQSAQDNDYSWYTPHVYLTAMIWTKEGWEQDVKLSFNLKLEITNADSTQCAMGLYKEQLEAQCRLLTDTANSIDPAGSAAGRSQPSWLYGGSRPEIMITSNNLLRYYNKLASNAYQEMDNITGFRTRFKEATTMVNFDAAFGDTSTNIPNWITLMDVAGVTSGPIRSYPPPVKFSGNGNTVMYDAAGIPATIVT